MPLGFQLDRIAGKEILDNPDRTEYGNVVLGHGDQGWWKCVTIKWTMLIVMAAVERLASPLH